VLLLALVNPRFAATGRILNLLSRAVRQPFYWPTEHEMRRLVRGAGFDLREQRRLFRIPGALFVPPVLTVATVRRRRERVRAPTTQRVG
jgi:hypothetical protein